MKKLDGERTFAWPVEKVSAIAAPVLLVYGDSDAIRPGHMVELFRLLGGGVPGDLTGLPKSQLAIIPGTTHVTIGRRSHRISGCRWSTAFLAAPLPE